MPRWCGSVRSPTRPRGRPRQNLALPMSTISTGVSRQSERLASFPFSPPTKALSRSVSQDGHGAKNKVPVRQRMVAVVTEGPAAFRPCVTPNPATCGLCRSPINHRLAGERHQRAAPEAGRASSHRRSGMSCVALTVDHNGNGALLRAGVPIPISGQFVCAALSPVCAPNPSCLGRANKTGRWRGQCSLIW